MVTVMTHERAVHYRHGELVDVLAPGRHRFWTTGHTFVRVDTRLQVLDVRPQEIATSDGITVKVGVAARLAVVDPVAHLEHAVDPHAIVYDAVKAWLRETVRRHTLDEVLAGIVVDEVPASVASAASTTGYDLTDFAVRDVIVPAEIRRAAEELVTARQQAQIGLERARGEVAVTRALANGAKILEDHPLLASIRMIETAASHGGTIVVERPADRPAT
jgi:regulator of protease activity HflC (stomatin/prohibitin superfamily)